MFEAICRNTEDLKESARSAECPYREIIGVVPAYVWRADSPYFCPWTPALKIQHVAASERPCFDILEPGCAMHYVLKLELLEAMKDCLHDLENVKLLSPDDLDIIDEKRILRHKIAELEKEDSNGNEMAA
jgi:hypothetical protein